MVCRTNSILTQSGVLPLPVRAAINVTVKRGTSNTSPVFVAEFSEGVDTKFLYATPQVTSITPSFGPISGGTFVVINGTYLNIGNNASVRLANQDCAIQ